MVRLTGWSNSNPCPSLELNFSQHFSFPYETSVTIGKFAHFYVLGGAWDLRQFTYELITPQTDTPAFATIPPDQFQFVCRKFGLTPTDGVHPATKQAVICSPDGTAAVFFICHVEAVPTVNITVIDGEVNAIVHDKI